MLYRCVYSFILTLYKCPCITDSVVEKMAVGYWIPAVGGQGSEEAPLIDLGWIGPTGQMYSTTADLNKVSASIYKWQKCTPVPNLLCGVLASFSSQQVSASILCGAI